MTGIDRDWVGVPVRYPTSCTPQAWSAASPLYLLRILLGLEPSEHESVVIEPHMPAWLPDASVDGVSVGSRRFSFSVSGRRRHVEVMPDAAPAAGA
jgi:glycogen debranching enzyme